MPYADKAKRQAYHQEYIGRWRKNSPAYREWLAKYQKEYKQRPEVLARYFERLGYPAPTRPMPERCELCDEPSNGNGRLHLDHDHTLGIFRGWLCYKCNAAIGMLGDTIAGVERAVAYLKKAGSL